MNPVWVHAVQTVADEHDLQPEGHAKQPEFLSKKYPESHEIGGSTICSQTPYVLRYWPSLQAHPPISALYWRFNGHWAHLPWYLNWLEGHVNSHWPVVAFLR